MAAVQLLLADVDGTLVTQEKVLTDEAVEAVQDLRAAGIRFAVTSGRPPAGMKMLIEPLALDTPIAGFNGGVIVDPGMKVLEQHSVAEDLVAPIVEVMRSFDLDVWKYRGADWFVNDAKAPHVDRETWTVKFDPKVVADTDDIVKDVAKLVGVSDDHDAIIKATEAVHERFGAHVTAAASQPYYLDVTHPNANKGYVVKFLAQRYGIDTAAIATIGDMPNDILMFKQSGLSIAMGNAGDEVQHSATAVTDKNDDEGFAKAVRRFVIPGKQN